MVKGKKIGQATGSHQKEERKKTKQKQKKNPQQTADVNM